MINKTLRMYEGREGFFPVSENCKIDTYFTTSEADLQAATEYIEANRRKPLYVPIATFEEHNRTIVAIKELAAHFIDIDSHLIQATETEIRELKNTLIHAMQAGRIPYGDIKDSGRGIGIIIHLIPGSIDIAKWNATQEGLQNVFSDILAEYNIIYGVEKMTLDRAVKNANRLTRVTGSYNAKAHKYCKMLYTTARQYTQAEILEKYGLYITDRKGKRTDLKGLANATPEEILNATQQQLRQFKGYGCYTRDTLRQARLKDLYALIQQRNRRHQLQSYRENLIYIAAYLIREKNTTAEDLAEELLQLNSLFAQPLTEPQVLKHCRYVMQTPQKYFKNSTIIALLDISEAERADFLTIITNAESRKRRNRRYYDNSSAYRIIKTVNQNIKDERIRKVKELKVAGKSYTEIAKALHISRRTAIYYNQAGKVVQKI